MRKVLFLDVPGVLNDSQSAYNYKKFDADKMLQLKRIIEATGCELVFVPDVEDPTINGQVDLLINVLKSLWQTPIKQVYTIEGVLREFQSDGGIKAYAVLRYHDGRKKEWSMTFPTRYVCTQSAAKQAVGDEGYEREMVVYNPGLTRANAEAAIALLNMDLQSDEVPIAVQVYRQEILDKFQMMRRREEIANKMIDTLMAKKGYKKDDIHYFKHWTECMAEVSNMLDLVDAEIKKENTNGKQDQ